MKLSGSFCSLKISYGCWVTFLMIGCDLKVILFWGNILDPRKPQQESGKEGFLFGCFKCNIPMSGYIPSRHSFTELFNQIIHNHPIFQLPFFLVSDGSSWRTRAHFTLSSSEQKMSPSQTLTGSLTGAWRTGRTATFQVLRSKKI
jgi:hypothetical protein